MQLSGWGNFPVRDACLYTPRTEAELIHQIRSGHAIARGNGRAYGDSAVSQQNTIHMRYFNRMLAFNEQTGYLVAEAGVLLADIIAVFLPRGWFPFVTPGTKFVTIGGMIAADVHGKNHHQVGSLANFIEWIDLIDGQGEIQHCSGEQQAELFAWTLGGMGLTGIILRAALRLRPVETGWIQQTTHQAPDLATVMALFEQNRQATYSVAWIDCLSQGNRLGRSLLMLGEHATDGQLGRQHRARRFPSVHKTRACVPSWFPGHCLNRWTVRTFNHLYYWRGAYQRSPTLVDWDHYFYPLDTILGWNRLYGRKGFIQFQCVLPLQQSEQGLRLLLEAIAQAQAGSFLAVLKRLGAQNSRFSFPLAGYTLALDFPSQPET